MKNLIVFFVLIICMLLFTPIRASTITGDTLVCVSAGGTSGYILNISCQYPADWSLNGGGTVNGSGVGNPPDYYSYASITWNTSGTWILTGTSSVACDNSTRYNLTITVNIVPGTPTFSSSSSNTEICSSESWVLTSNSSGYPSNYGYDWYSGGTGSLNINGTSYTSNNPLHTQDNSVTIAPGSLNGVAVVYSRLNNSNGCPSQYGTTRIQVGVYNSSDYSVVGPTNVCANGDYTYSSSVGTQDILDYSWTVPRGWSFTGQGTNSIEVTPSATGGNVLVGLTNRCGISSPGASLHISNGPGCQQIVVKESDLKVSPNPASQTLNVQLDYTGENEQMDGRVFVALYNGFQQIVLQGHMDGKKLQMNVSGIPNGLYYLKLSTQNGFISEHIVISH